MNIEFNKESYELTVWRRGSPVLTGEFLAVDTETEKLVIGAPIKPVLLQVANVSARRVQLVWHRDIGAYWTQFLVANPGALIIMHNAPFDMDVLGMFHDPRLEALVDSGRLVDTSIRYVLHALREGFFVGRYALDHAVNKLLGVKLEKDEEIRLTFKQSMVPDASWTDFIQWFEAGADPALMPPETSLTVPHIRYAALDPIATARLYECLPRERLDTEDVQLRGYFGLQWITKNGFAVDTEERERLEKQFQGLVGKDLDILSYWGFIPREKGNKGVAQEVMETIEQQLDVHLPRTEKSGEISVNNKMLDVLLQAGVPIPAFVRALRGYTHNNKMLSTYLHKDLVGVDDRVHPSFSPLVKTGRTSCREPNIQNVPRDGGLRGIYVAKPGHVLLASDYSQIELCALAQSCLHRFGRSRLAEVINSGQDVHHWFGQLIKQNDKRPESEKSTDKQYRQLAKIPNFGLPGGLGAAKLVEYARFNYKVSITEDTAKELKALWLSTFPEMALHLKPRIDPTAYPDGQQWYMAETVNGRLAIHETYNTACNYPFQGLVADGAKVAAWWLYLRRLPVVNFVHDEFILELREDDPKLQETIREVSAIMVDAMKLFIPDVKVKTESALMRRWSKQATEVRDEEGNLLIWTPALQEKMDRDKKQKQEAVKTPVSGEITAEVE